MIECRDKLTYRLLFFQSTFVAVFARPDQPDWSVLHFTFVRGYHLRLTQPALLIALIALSFLLVALWVFATLKGIGSARELERLCANHLAYQWLCGGVSVNHHMLADVRSQGGEKWDELLTPIVATLMADNKETDRQLRDLRADPQPQDHHPARPGRGAAG